MNREHFKFFFNLRVRYAEIDSQGIVFNAHYLTYFDTALTEYMREIDFDYQAMVSEENIDFHLVKSTVEYRGPIGFDDVIDVGVTVKKIGNSSLTWNLAIFKQDSDVCETLGEIIWVCSEIAKHKSHPLPKALIDAISSYET